MDQQQQFLCLENANNLSSVDFEKLLCLGFQQIVSPPAPFPLLDDPATVCFKVLSIETVFAFIDSIAFYVN